MAQFLRFCFVGIVNTAVGVLFMLLLHWLRFDYWFTTFTGNGLGIGLSFALNKQFTFGERGGIRKFGPYLIVSFLSYFAAYSPVYLILSKYDLKPYIAFIIAAGCYTVLNFVGQKFIVFGRPSN